MNLGQVKVGVGAVIIKDGFILLAKRKGSHGEGCYGSVGGHVEFGEDLVEAVKREAMEELGVKLKEVEFICCMNLKKYSKHYVDIEFLAQIESGEPSICEPEKIESVGWYPLDQLPEPLFKPVEIVLHAIKTGTQYYEINEDV